MRSSDFEKYAFVGCKLLKLIATIFSSSVQYVDRDLKSSLSSDELMITLQCGGSSILLTVEVDMTILWRFKTSSLVSQTSFNKRRLNQGV